MPGTDLFFQYADEAERKVQEREAQDRLKAEIVNNDRARRMSAGGPTEDPPPPAPTEDPTGLKGYPLRYRTQLDETGVVDVMGVGDPTGGEQIEDRVDLTDLAPSHVLSKDTIGTSLLKGVKQTGGQVLQGVGGAIRNVAENAGVDASLGAVYGAVDKLGLDNPGLTAYMDTVKKLQSALGLDAPLDSIANVGAGIGKKGEEIVKANLSAAGTDYLQQQVQSSVASVGLSVSALGLSFLTKNPMLGLSLMGAISGGQQYMDSREFGDSASWSAVTAGLNTTAEILGEKLGFEKLLSVGEDAAKKEIKKAIFDGLQAWGLDIGGELLTTVAQDLISKMSDRPNLTTAELQSDLVDTFWSTLFMGPMQTAIVGGMGGAARLVTKSDIGARNFKEHVEQNFDGATVNETGFGAEVVLPSGRTVEIHTANSPAAEELHKEALDKGDPKSSQMVRSGERVLSGVYFKSGSLVGTENDLIFLTGQADLTTLPHEKGHLVVSVLQDVLTPEERAAIGLPEEGKISIGVEEAVMDAFEEYAYNRTPSIENPMSPLDKAFQKVIDFAHEIYSDFGGATERQVFEQMRTGKILQREGAVRMPGESDAAFQVRTIRPAWHEDDVKTKSGQIVGAPGSHLSHQAREGLIRRMVTVATKMHEVNPEQARWYEMSGEDVRRLFGLTQKEPGGEWQGNIEGADQFLRAVAQWSIQADVGRNTEDAVNVIHQIARGEEAATAGVMTNAQTQAQRFVDTMAASEASNDLAGFGEKATSFYWDLHNATFKVRDDINTTIDRHIIGGWDLASRTGRPMEGLKGPQYRWGNNVMREITKRFNAQNGTDYTPSQIQPLLWAWQRGGRVFEKGNVDHIGAHLGVGIVTGEIVPATNSDVTPWIHEANYETKRALSTYVVEKTLYDADGENVILPRLQFPQGGVVQGIGTFEGAVNPNVISTMPLQDMRPELANLYADLFGYIYTQNAVPWYRADRTLNGVEGKTQGYAISRGDGPITDSLVRSFYDILKTKIKGADLTFLGDEIHVVNFMGIDQAEFHAKIQEVADGWAKENDIASNHWQFGTEGDYRQGDADGAERWTGEEYLSRILAAGSPALRDWARSQREAAVAAAREFSQEVAPPGAKFQAKDQIDYKRTFLFDINNKDITPAVKAAALNRGETIRSIGTNDRIWLLSNGDALSTGFQIHQGIVDDLVALATSEPIGRKIPYEEFGAATQSIRFHGYQGDQWRLTGERDASLNFEVFAPITEKQMEIISKSVGRNGKILVDISTYEGVGLTYVMGSGPEAIKTLKETVEKAYNGDAKFQTRPYKDVPDSLMGFSKDGGKQKGFDETKYPVSLPVKVTLPNGDTFDDEIKGMNREHALERARRNWRDATVQAVGGMASTVQTPAGEFPLDHQGWKFQGEMMGYYQYTLADPDRPDFTPTLLVDKPENLQKKIDLTLAKWDPPKMQTKEFLKWFGNSKVVDEKGKPLVMYHGTEASFDEFKGAGIHFGTAEQANARIGNSPLAISETLAAGGPFDYQKGRRLIPVFLKIENPVRLPDLNTWGASNVAPALEKAGAIDSGDLAKVMSALERGEGRKSAWSILRGILDEKGIDGIVYDNRMEGRKGGDSYIVFSPDQIKSVFNAKPRAGDPRFQTRTPGPKGLTVNFTSPEVSALGEEMLRGAFEKLQYEQTNDQTTKKAQALLASGKVSLGTFLNHDPYTAWPDSAHQVAAEAIAGGVFDFVKDQIAEYKAGRISADEANKARMIGMASIASWYLPQSEVGRMLQARQIAVTPEGVPVKDLMAEQMKFETDLQEMKNRGLVTDEQALDAMDQFYSVDQAQNFARRVAAKKVGDISVLNQLFYFSLLSNPVTQSANLIGNLGPVFFAIAEQYLSEKIPYSATPRGGAEGMAAGLYHGLLDAFVLAKRAAVTGESSFGGSKFRAESPTGVPAVDQARQAIDQIMADKTHPFHDPASPQYDAAKRDVARLHRLGSNAISGERFSRLSSGSIDANGSMARVIDLLGTITDSPFKGLAAGDEFFKVIAYRMSIYKSAYQLAATQGLEGEAFDNFVATFIEDPTPTADAEAKDFAAKQTFTNEMGEIGQFLQKMSNKEAVGPIVKFFIPFVKITTNIGLYNVERVPILNLVLKQVRDDMAAGGKKRDAAIAKTVSGGAVMLAFAGLAMAGMVTGGGPADPKLKQLWSQPDENGNVAWQEYSLKINGKWISYKRLEPFATMIGIAADMVEVSRAFNVDVGEMFLVGALAGIRNMTSKTWMLGVSQIIDTLTSGGAEDLGRNAKKLGRQLPSLLIPGGLAQAARVTDPVKRDVQSWMDVIKSRTPGLSSDLEPKYTLKGDPVTVQMYDSMPGKGFGMINPILYTGNTKDPVSLELVRNRIPISMPSRRLGGGMNPDAPNIEGKETGVDLTPEQYGWFVKMAGNGLKDPKTGRGAWDELTAIINGDIPADYNYQKGKKPEALYYNQKNPDGTPVFSDGPEGGKAFIITQVLLDARNQVRQMIESGEAFPELGVQYEEKKMRKEIRQAPQVGGAR